jgi:hypothetical protein
MGDSRFEIMSEVEKNGCRLLEMATTLTDIFDNSRGDNGFATARLTV